MINFSFKKQDWKFRAAINKTMNPSYLKDFNKALINLEMNLQEERMKIQPQDMKNPGALPGLC